MKNFLNPSLFYLMIAFLLTSCSTKLPPPKQLESTNFKQTGNDPKTFYTFRSTPKIIKQQYIKSEQLTNFRFIALKPDVVNFVPEPLKIRFMFLASHSNKIQIVGQDKYTNLYKSWLTSLGIKAEILTETTPKAETMTFYFELNEEGV